RKPQIESAANGKASDAIVPRPEPLEPSSQQGRRPRRKAIADGICQVKAINVEEFPHPHCQLPPRPCRKLLAPPASVLSATCRIHASMARHAFVIESVGARGRRYLFECPPNKLEPRQRVFR